ncbi:uncharacterized protein LOC118218168 isoform X2 [Anguilla anguilla]|uniref:uncharacterized protein LOC118218168 isoform X2 n=1 Tax=Anguilla anguilla TaxID=7936 RepID=UPI0015B10778|nr:uncharacterized protein LOC118218168 isoform X2 [Anguilla anguilla]
MKLLNLFCVIAGLWRTLSAGRSCPDLIIDGCRCTSERHMELSRQTVRVKVVCSGAELMDTFHASFLPNTTVSLVLGHNKISLLKNGSFLGLSYLERLDLKNNLISTIEPGAFHGLAALRRLDLSNNRIGCLSPEMFVDLSSLSKLNLSGNIFSSLPEGLFTHLLSLQVLYFSSESLYCDCHLQWLLLWARANSVRIGNGTPCAYPTHLHGLEFRSLREHQLKCVGPLELPLFQLIPSQRQVVFRGDRLPLQCTASYLDRSVKLQWSHNGRPASTQEQSGVLVEDSIVHDCCQVTSELILSNIDIGLSGHWTCLVTSSRGNGSRSMEIVVLETSAPYCPAERVTNNKGDFRWPRTLAGILAFLPCLPHPFGSPQHSSAPREKKAWRRCDRAGRWAEEDYTQCAYANEFTRVLYQLSQMAINTTNAQALAQQLSAFTTRAALFDDKMDVIFVTHIMERLMRFVDRIQDLGDYVSDIASNMMQVEEHVLWMAQNEARACTRMVQCVERIADLALTSHTQVISKVSPNIALEAFMIKPSSFTGLSCTAVQRAPLTPEGDPVRPGEPEKPVGSLLNFKCSMANTSASLLGQPGKDLKKVLSFPPYPGEFLHPVVYACTAVMLLCLFASIITYIVHHSAIRISRKGWHMLLNFCFHTALTFAVFAGGINRVKYPVICQAVGIVLHYSSLSTMLWLGVTARNIYKQVTKKPPHAQDGDPPPSSKQPLLRFYLVSGGVPFIICGITAATNIDNYGSGEQAPYCWMAWETSLGAFYGPVAFIVLVTCVYFLCIYIQLKHHPERKYELKPVTEEQQRLAAGEVGHCHAADPGAPPHSHSRASCPALNPSLLANEHSFKAQLRTAAFTLFLFLATWAFGALAVSQGHFLDMIFSCLYGAFSVTLGLFVLIHHCAKRDDVWHCWCACCPARRHACQGPGHGHARPKVNVNGDTQLHTHAHSHAHCHLDSPCPGKALLAHGHAPSAHCKLSGLQAVQNHVACLSPVAPCCAALHSQQLLDDEPHVHLHADVDGYRPNVHVHRCLKGRTKPRHFGGRHRPGGGGGSEREYAYHIPSSVDGGSVHSSHTDSPHSTHERHARHPPPRDAHGCHALCHRHVCCGKAELFPTVCQPEGADAASVLYGCAKMAEEEMAHRAHLEMHPRRQSYPQNPPPNQNGILKGSMHEGFLYSSDSTGNIRTGPWRNETTV